MHGPIRRNSLVGSRLRRTTKLSFLNLDFKVGGKYRLEVHHKGGNIHRLSGTYQEIKPPEKLVFTWSWGPDPDAHQSIVTVEFRDLGPSTEITLTHVQLPSVEERDKHSHGWSGVFEQFAKYL